MDASAAPSHLIVLLHGVAGSGANLAVLAGVLRSRYGAIALVLVPECYRHTGTYDGICTCAGRVLRELREAVAAHPSLTALSLCGYSFGGLVARYLAGVLFAERPAPFLGLRPLNLVTFACPHLGPALLPNDAGADAVAAATAAARQPRQHRGGLSLFLLRRLAGLSGAQMALADSQRLLLLMAHPGSVFWRGLAAFERRAIYANAANDRTVPHWTAFIAPWRDGAPLPPPPPQRAVSDADPYPHVEWEGVVGGGGASSPAAAADTPCEPADAAHAAVAGAASPAAGAALLTGALAGPPVRLAAATEEALRRRDVARLLMLLPVGLILVPLWLTIVPAGLVSMGLYKRHTLRAPPLPAELLVLSSSSSGDVAADEEPATWPAALAAAEGAVAAPQAWMAARLNTLAWHKVSVRFSVRRDGLTALHTHGHVIVRRRGTHAMGMDVLRHVADTLRHTAPDNKLQQ